MARSRARLRTRAARSRRRCGANPHRAHHSVPSRRRQPGLDRRLHERDRRRSASRSSAGCSRTRATASALTGAMCDATPDRPPASELIDAFCDQVWLQDGLAAGVARELSPRSRRVGGWLGERAALCSPPSAPTSRLARRPVPRQGEGHVGRAAAVVAAPLLPAAAASGHGARRIRRCACGAEAAAPPAEEPVRGAGGSAARGARRRHHARPARPRDARDALRDGPARLRARRPQARAGVARRRRRARDRQGQQGAARAARRRSGRVDRALPRVARAPSSLGTASAIALFLTARRGPLTPPGVLAAGQALRVARRHSRRRRCRRTCCATRSRRIC